MVRVCKSLYIFQKMPKRKKDFSIEEDCFICQDDIKDPKTKYRKNIAVINFEAAVVKEKYDLWKKKQTYPAVVR